MLKPSSICVYCGSAEDVAQPYKDAAAELGRIAGENGIDVVYGGGRSGLMGLVANAALLAGGRVIGVLPQAIVAMEVAHGALTETIVVDTIHRRKQTMADRAEAFVILPGGLGTLDEGMEILAWRQLRFHDRPVVIVNVDGYWDPLLAMLERAAAEGFIYARGKTLFRVVTQVEHVLPAIAAQLAE
ncbi:MAG TPA: TIGR00730 family Rossman fold protein [Alphaproteobacteria bacterium]|nr:TIGR00730 family Rossman fold protein [Alphaproteobacteria bacterium]